MERWATVRVPATTANLGPGFDALGLALGWHEVAHLALTGTGLEVRVTGPGAQDVPCGEDNLVVRGARAVLAATAAPERGLAVALELRVPVGRGLGSSAAAVAAGVVGTNALLGSPLPPEALVELAASVEGHPDNVAPAILGGLCAACTLATGRVLTVRLEPPPGLAAVVAIPAQPLATALARQALPATVPFADAVANVQRACLLVAALAAGRLDALGEATADRLHQPYRAHLVPGLQACLDGAAAAGALGAFLSGAGPSVLALVPEVGGAAGAVAAAMRRHLDAHGGGEVRQVPLSSAGASVLVAP